MQETEGSERTETCCNLFHCVRDDIHELSVLDRHDLEVRFLLSESERVSARVSVIDEG